MSLFELALGPFRLNLRPGPSLWYCPWNAGDGARALSAGGAGRVLKLALSRVFLWAITRPRRSNAVFFGKLEGLDFQSDVKNHLLHPNALFYILRTP